MYQPNRNRGPVKRHELWVAVAENRAGALVPVSPRFDRSEAAAMFAQAINQLSIDKPHLGLSNAHVVKVEADTIQ